MLSIEKLKAKTYDYWSIAVRPKKVEVTGVRQHVVQDSTVSLLCKVMYIWINYFVCVTGFSPSFFLVSSYFLTTKFNQNESTNPTYPASFPCTFWELDEIIAFVRAKQYCTTHCLCVNVKASSKVQIDGSSTFSYRFTHSTKFQDILRVFDEFNDFELVYYWKWPRRPGFLFFYLFWIKISALWQNHVSLNFQTNILSIYRYDSIDNWLKLIFPWIWTLIKFIKYSWSSKQKLN